MAFSLYKFPGGTVPTERCVADTGGVTGGQIVKMTAGAVPPETRPKVVQITGGASNADLAYGVALHDATATNEVLVIPLRSGMRFLADAAAAPSAVNAAQLKAYPAATAAQLVTINGSALTQLQSVIDVVGISDDGAKYIVAFNPAAVKSF